MALTSRTKHIKNILYVLIFFLLMSPFAVFALNLEEAKAKGLVGEEPSGYLGVVVQSAEAANLAQDINEKRREKYKQIASQNGTPISAVEALAGKKALESSPPGAYIKSGAGTWIKK